MFCSVILVFMADSWYFCCIGISQPLIYQCLAEDVSDLSQWYPFILLLLLLSYGDELLARIIANDTYSLAIRVDTEQSRTIWQEGVINLTNQLEISRAMSVEASLAAAGE